MMIWKITNASTPSTTVDVVTSTDQVFAEEVLEKWKNTSPHYNKDMGDLYAVVIARFPDAPRKKEP